MECNKKCGAGGCNLLSVFISIAVGIIVAILFSMGMIPVTLNFIRIALIMSVIAMGVLWATLFQASIVRGCGISNCVCSIAKCLLAGAIGTFLSTTAAATAGLTVTSIFSIVFVGLSALFFVLMIIQIVSLILCIIDETC